MRNSKWYRFENAAGDPSVVDVQIIDFIGGWVDEWFGDDQGVITAKAFTKQLAALADNVKTIRVHINSPGGDVFGAAQIANALRDQQASKGRSVETIVEGLAASAASVVMMAGSKIRIADNALVMIHNPWTIGIGEAKDMRKVAEELDTVRNSIVATYKWHSTLKDEEIVALMDAETWMDADEAIANGFATEKVEGLKAAASLMPKAVAKLQVPEKFRARVDALVKQPDPDPEPMAAAAVLTACAEAGLELAFAQTLVSASLPAADVTSRIAAEKQRQAQDKARAQEITGICATAKLPELAAGYIAGAMSVQDIRAHVQTITTKLDKVEIDSNLDPDHGANKSASWKTAFGKANHRRTH